MQCICVALGTRGAEGPSCGLMEIHILDRQQGKAEVDWCCTAWLRKPAATMRCSADLNHSL